MHGLNLRKMWGQSLLAILLLHSCLVLPAPTSYDRQTLRQTIASRSFLLRNAYEMEGDDGCEGGPRIMDRESDLKDELQGYDRGVQRTPYAFVSARVSSLSRPGYPCMSYCRPPAMKGAAVAANEGAMGFQSAQLQQPQPQQQPQQSASSLQDKEGRREGPVAAEQVAGSSDNMSWSMALSSIAPSLMLRMSKPTESRLLSSEGSLSRAFLEKEFGITRTAALSGKRGGRRLLTIDEAHRLACCENMRAMPSAPLASFLLCLFACFKSSRT